MTVHRKGGGGSCCSRREKDRAVVLDRFRCGSTGCTTKSSGVPPLRGRCYSGCCCCRDGGHRDGRQDSPREKRRRRTTKKTAEEKASTKVPTNEAKLRRRCEGDEGRTAARSTSFVSRRCTAGTCAPRSGTAASGSAMMLRSSRGTYRPTGDALPVGGGGIDPPRIRKGVVRRLRVRRKEETANGARELRCDPMATTCAPSIRHISSAITARIGASRGRQGQNRGVSPRTGGIFGGRLGAFSVFGDATPSLVKQSDRKAYLRHTTDTEQYACSPNTYSLPL